AHRDAVTDADRVEPESDEPCRLYAFLYLLGELQQVHVARVSLIPDARDANLRFLKILIRKPGRVEHRLRSALRLRRCDVRTVFIALFSHDFVVYTNSAEQNGAHGEGTVESLHGKLHAVSPVRYGIRVDDRKKV